jgi:type VI secretion system secreted protein VgrG
VSAELPITYALEVDGATYPVREASGVEAVSRPFRIALRFVPSSPGFEPDALLRSAASIRLHRDGEVVRRVDGVVTEASIAGSTTGAPEALVVVEPRLALAGHRRDSRVFRDRTAPEIVVEVLAAIGVVPELRLANAYARRAYCVQYEETDFAFVSRLLEAEGIFYFLLEGDTLVLADRPNAFEPLPGGTRIQFQAAAALDGGREAVTELSERASLAAGRVTLRDFDPDHPRADLDVTEIVGAAGGGPEFYDFPGEYKDPSVGRHLARVRAEAFATAASELAGTSTSARLAPGHVIEVLGAPLDVDARLVVTELSHAFSRDAAGFANAFRARPADAAFRAPQVTPAPLAPSLMTGIVTGPPGEDIHTDAAGRVKVHFPWDRASPFDDSCSDWIPVLQDNTGGSSAMPRVGWEVLVSFLEGDPDRPVVLGRLYNGADPFPEPLPAGKTRTALRSLTSPSRVGVNMIRIDDQAGAERVHLLSERDQNIVIGNVRQEDVLRDEATEVEGNERIVIGTDLTTTIGQNHLAFVDGSQVHAVGADRTKTIGGAEQASIGGDHTLSIGVDHTRTIGADDVVSALGIQDTVGGMILDKLGMTKDSAADAAMLVTVGGVYLEAAGQTKSESADRRTEAIGGVVLTAARGGIIESAGATRTTTVGGLLSASAAKGVALHGGATFDGTAGGAVKVSGATKISLVVGDSKVVLEGPCIEVKAATITLSIEGQGNLDSDGSHLNS